MASVNQVTIIGNLGRDPEIRYAPSGDAIATLAIATTSKWKDKASGEQKEETEWHRVTFFGRMGEICGQYLKKGGSVYVQGRLKTTKYTDKEGIERYTTGIIGENMQMLGGRQDGGANDNGGQGSGDVGKPYNTGPENARQAAGQRPAPKPAPNFSDMDDDIPF